MAKGSLRAARLAAAGLIIMGTVLTANGLWIPAKAALAQHLLERAWQRTLSGRPRAAPWPWADTWPVARLTIRGRGMIVLRDSGGAGLAFGPTHVAGSAAPGGPGTVVVSAHRDTHFRGLDRLQPGEVIGFEARDGQRRRYRVTGSIVLDKPEMAIPSPAMGDALALVTCWPLNGIDPGTQKRFILHAKAITGP
jgi:sortase A